MRIMKGGQGIVNNIGRQTVFISGRFDIGGRLNMDYDKQR